MKYLKYILAISLCLQGFARIDACGPYYPDDPNHILMFRSCSQELERQWQEGCRFQDYEKEQNCLLWQQITSSSIPIEDIKEIVYDARLADLSDLSEGTLPSNKFTQWLSSPIHREDLDYIRIAKEIEEIREYMNNPWYYPYEEDDEHSRLAELKGQCKAYNGQRHAPRYALQLMRLYFAVSDFKSCIDLWENQVCSIPQTIVTDMIASYAGGAYIRNGNRDKAIELFTRSQDIGSLINLKAWNGVEDNSNFSDERVKELEYIFNRFPNSPLLSVKLQEYVRNRESFVYYYKEWKDRNFHDPVLIKTYWSGDSLIADDEPIFYNELRQFAQNAVENRRCHQKGMWNYALGYLYYLDGNFEKALAYLNRAEQSLSTPFIKESLKAFRFLMNAQYANNSISYKNQLLRDLKWIDERMVNDVKLNPGENWQYKNKMNWRVGYWQDVTRKVLLGVVCPKMKQSGNITLALQLANYASNRICQLCPLYEAYYSGYNDPKDIETYTVILPMDEYRKNYKGRNYFDWQSQFFEWIYNSKAYDAAEYAQRIHSPKCVLDKFLNERGYVDTDYIYDIVGTLYMREMNYDRASQWLSKVTSNYQSRMNIAKEGYFKLDPFRYQFSKKQYINDSTDYKLKFAQEMVRLERMMNSDSEVNRKAEAKIRYAIGLRNSFGRCWFLTDYGYNTVYDIREDKKGETYSSIDRDGFNGNTYAQKAYKRVDLLIAEALSDFSNPEKAAQAQLEMMNYATLIKKYPHTRVALQIRTRCDKYYDYALQKR